MVMPYPEFLEQVDKSGKCSTYPVIIDLRWLAFYICGVVMQWRIKINRLSTVKNMTISGAFFNTKTYDDVNFHND